MDSYCNINDAYLNKGFNNKSILGDNNLYSLSSDDLEKMARKINDDKSKNVYNGYKKSSRELERGAKTIQNMQMNNTDRGMYIQPRTINETPESEGFYSAQGEYYNPKSMEGTLIGNIHKGNIKSESESEGISISIDTPTDSIDNNKSDNSSDFSSESSISSESTESSNSTTWDTNEIDKHIRTKSKYNNKKKSKRHKCIDFDLQSVDSLGSLDSGDSLLRHIRFCHECKSRVIDLIRKHKTDNKKVRQQSANDKIENKTINNNNVTDDNKKDIYTTYELKEIVMIVLLGILVVMLLDFMFRK